MAELISMVEFVLTDKYTATDHKNYATFLKQPLEIWMFIPCKLVDGNWVVLEEPIFEELLPMNEMDEIYEEYQQAKSLCLFEGFEFVEDNQNTWVFKFKNETWFIQKDENVEFLTDMEITLTPAAEKQIGL